MAGDRVAPGHSPSWSRRERPEDIAHLRRIGDALTAIAADEAELAAAVGAARSYARSRASIGTALGISRQTAAERFSTASRV